MAGNGRKADRVAGDDIAPFGDGGVIEGASVDPATVAGTGDDGDVDGTGQRFDPAIHSGRDKRNADGSYRRKRGRKSGSGGSATGKASSSGDIKAAAEMLSQTLMLLHVGIASSTRCPEMVLDKGESDMLAKATVNVMEQFDITPDPKVQAMAGLIIAAGTVYGPRVYLIRDRVKQEAKQRENPGGAIVEFPGPVIQQ